MGTLCSMSFADLIVIDQSSVLFDPKKSLPSFAGCSERSSGDSEPNSPYLDESSCSSSIVPKCSFDSVDVLSSDSVSDSVLHES